MAAGVAVWSVATFVSGLARGAWSLARRARGRRRRRGELRDGRADAHRRHGPAGARRGAGSRSSTSAIPIGSALGYVLGGFLETRVGWRARSSSSGGPGLLAALSASSSPSRRGRPGKRPPGSARLGEALARVPLYRRVVLGYCAYTFALGGFQHWAPTYMHTRFDIDPATQTTCSASFGRRGVHRHARSAARGGACGATGRSIARRRRRPARTGEMYAAIARGLWRSALGATIRRPLAAVARGRHAPPFFAFIFRGIAFVFLLTAPINAAILERSPSSFARARWR